MPTPHPEPKYDDDLEAYRLAPSYSETELGQEWLDKPHRLIYDLVRMCQEARDGAKEDDDPYAHYPGGWEGWMRDNGRADDV